MSETSVLTLRGIIQDFKDLQEFCLTYEHAIYEVPKSRPLYQTRLEAEEPVSRRASTFVYSFFVFNNLYSIDWHESVQHPDNEPEEAQGNQQEQFWKMADDCYKSNPIAAAESYSHNLRRYLQRFGIEKPMQKLKDIRRDENTDLENELKHQYDVRQRSGKETTMQSISDFRQSFKALYEYAGGGSGAISPENHQTHLNNVLYFVYKIRCSVFHSRKRIAVREVTRSQDIRLLIYSAALLATNQMVLNYAERALDV